jgi:hypothetical protein
MRTLGYAFRGIWKCGACGGLWCQSCVDMWPKLKDENGMRLRSGRQLVPQ